MTTRAFQCCYTNATRVEGGVTKTGWQPVAVSSDIPSSALEGCTRLQSLNSAIQGRMTDESGETLNLLEVIGDSEYVYVMRTLYGLSDNYGRANMFSQAFVFPWSEEALRDPNVILGIKDENFSSSEEEAEGSVNRLTYDAPLTLERAMQEAGITQESYLTLIRCVVARLIDRSISTPLHVQYDGAPHTMRAILYCIYMGLPYELRRRLSAASCPSLHTGTKLLVFTTDASAKRLHVDPTTGRNNILTNRLKGRMSLAGYYDYAAARVGSIDVDAYFAALDRRARELGDTNSSDPLVLKLAHRDVIGFDYPSLNDDDLKDALSDALMADMAKGPAMEDLLSELLELAVEHDLSLSSMSERDLVRRLSNASTSRLSEVGERYLIHRFSAMGEDEAVERLMAMAADMRRRYLDQMQETERGRRIVDKYYESSVMQLAKPTWDDLGRILEESSTLTPRPATEGALDAAALRLYEALIDTPSNAWQAYDEYMDFVEKLLPESRWDSCDSAAREAFWRHVALTTISPDNCETYQRLDDGSEKARTAYRLSSVEQLLDDSDEERFLGLSWRLVSAGDSAPWSPNELLKHIDASIGSRYHGTDAYLSNWLQVICHAQTEDAVRGLLTLRRGMNAGSCSGVIKTLKGYVDAVWKGAISQEEASTAAGVALPFLQHHDERAPLSLDEWLTVGEALDSANPFAVFDKHKAAILRFEPAVVVRGSGFDLDMDSPSREAQGLRARYLSLGEAYVKRHGKESKAVKRWLAAAKKMGAYPGVNTGIAGAVGGLFSRLSRRGRDSSAADEHRSLDGGVNDGA